MTYSPLVNALKDSANAMRRAESTLASMRARITEDGELRENALACMQSMLSEASKLEGIALGLQTTLVAAEMMERTEFHRTLQGIGKS